MPYTRGPPVSQRTGPCATRRSRRAAGPHVPTHVKRIAHPHGPRRPPRGDGRRRSAVPGAPPPARAAALAGARAGVARRGDGGAVRRLPDVPELRLVLLAAVGARAARRRAAELRRLPRADPAPAGDRLRRGPVARWATPPTACWSRATLVSFVALAAGLYRLARSSFTSLVGLVAAALVCTRFDFPFLAARGYIDIPYLAFVVWAAALEAAHAAPGHAGARAAGRRRAAAPRGVAAERPVLAVAGAGAWAGGSACAAPCSSASAPWSGSRPTGSSPATRCSRYTHTSGLAEELGRQRGLARGPRGDVELPHRPRQGAGLLRGPGRAGAGRRARAAAHRRARWPCWPPAWRRSGSSAWPACRSSTATCSCRR